jgi:hypothetical protein
MAKIKSINPQVKGIQLQVPIDGLISVDANGFAVVSDKCAELLIKGTSDWESADAEHDEDDAEEQDFITKVKKMTLDEMVKLCEELGFDQNEYKKLLGKKTSEKLLAGYLIKKYSELEAAAEEGEDDEDVDDQNDSESGSEAEDSEDKDDEETEDAEETADETETDDDEDAEHDADDAEEQAEDKSKGKGKKSAAKGKK